MRRVKLHWYQTRNFGDALCPKLVSCLSGCNVEYAHPRSADIMGTGSVLFSGSAVFVEKKRLVSPYGVGKMLLKCLDAFYLPLHIWGSGFLCDPGVLDAVQVRKVRLCATRGRKTLGVFVRAGVVSKEASANVTLGDPGLLYPMLLDETPTKKYNIGVVPHFKDAEFGRMFCSAFEKSGVKVKLIDVLQDDSLNVVREIASCEKILSSSLHGLVVADALQIPNRHIVFSLLGQKKDEFMFKFEDYYSAFGSLDEDIIDGNSVVSPVEIFKMIPNSPRFAYDRFLERQEVLKASFPFKQ